MIFIIDMSAIRFKEILKESIIQSSYEDQLRNLFGDDSDDAKELMSFIEGQNTEKVAVVSDMRTVLPSFRFKRITNKSTFQKYPDIVFTFNFLIPYFTQMNSKQISVDSIKYLKAFSLDSPMTLYRFQNLQYDDPLKKKLETINIGEERIGKRELKIVTPHLQIAGFTRSAKTAQSAVVGSGIFGEREGYIYKANLQPIIDVQKYSEMILSSFVSVLGKIPKSLDSVNVYGTHEDEILAERLQQTLDIEKDVLMFAIGGRWFSPSEIIETKEKSELETKSVMFLVNYQDIYDGRSVNWTAKKMRVSAEQVDHVCSWFKDHKYEYRSVG